MTAATLLTIDGKALLGRFNAQAGTIQGAIRTERRLSDLAGIFADQDAYRLALSRDDPLIYSVEAVEPGSGDGDLHYGIGVIQPGKIGDEYNMTKGHLHTWRDAAELYVGLSGKGVMLLEDVASGESRMVPLEPGCAVYVPGNTGHRTANTGTEPLSYLGVFPARAGHDYGVYATRNFTCAILDRNGQPEMVRRSA